MPAPDLFQNEDSVLESADALLAKTQFADGETQAVVAGLVSEYRKLLRTVRRMMRLSDRNEQKLNDMAEQQRVASQDLAQKNRELEVLSSKLAKYLSPQLYDSIFEGTKEVQLASSRKKLTVFFSDIVGFTSITDKLESEELTNLLNHYLTEMSEVALEYGATIDKFVGDAVMVFFGDPQTAGVKEDALACVKMALAMKKRLKELNVIWQSDGLGQPLLCRIGLNTGFCTVGNFGSDSRMDYTIVGSTVNVAARLEQTASPDDILLSYETWVHVRDEVICEEVDEIKVKGVAHPVSVYRALGLKSNDESTRNLAHLSKNFSLFVDPDIMSDVERAQASKVLAQAIAALEKKQPGR